MCSFVDDQVSEVELPFPSDEHFTSCGGAGAAGGHYRCVEKVPLGPLKRLRLLTATGQTSRLPSGGEGEEWVSFAHLTVSFNLVRVDVTVLEACSYTVVSMLLHSCPLPH